MAITHQDKIEAGWSDQTSWMWQHQPLERQAIRRRLKVECGYPWQKGQTVSEMVSDAIELAAAYGSFAKDYRQKPAMAAHD